MNLTYFNIYEFDSPDVIGSGNKMQSSALIMLDTARRTAGLPFIITSGYRTKEHNKKVGGVENSAHTKGYAADIYTGDFTRAQKNRIIAALVKSGFERIGEAGLFIHVDNDPSKPIPAYWDYSDSNQKA